jgi:hypothetical protein
LRREALSGAIDSWAQNRPSQAAEFLSSLNSPEQKEYHVSTLVRHWSASDNARAEEWVSALPSGRILDEAAATLVESLTPSSPLRAMDWAGKVSDPFEKLRLQKEIFGYWASEDRGSAASWLESQETAQDPAVFQELKSTLDTIQ